VAVNGTVFILHTGALNHFTKLRPDQFFQNHITSTYVERGIEAVKRELKRDYECTERDGKFYVLEPKPNEGAVTGLEKATRIAVNGTVFVVHDDAMSHVEALFGASPQTYLSQAHRDGKLDEAKRRLLWNLDCEPFEKMFYVLGERPGAITASRRKLRDIVDEGGPDRVMRGSSRRFGPEDHELLSSNLYEASGPETKVNVRLFQ